MSIFLFQEDKSLAKVSLLQYEGIIFLSTLDGSFIAVDQRTGKTLWNFHDGMLVDFQTTKRL